MNLFNCHLVSPKTTTIKGFDIFIKQSRKISPKMILPENSNSNKKKKQTSQPFLWWAMIYNTFQNVFVTILLRRKEHKGIPFSPIFNHPVYCTPRRIKNFISFLFFALYLYTNISFMLSIIKVHQFFFPVSYPVMSAETSS